MQAIRLVVGAVVASTVSPSVLAQNVFATHVVAHDTMGNLGGGIFNPANALGSPNGATHVHTLGIGGWLTLGFGVTIANGPGADFLVAENPFHIGFADTYAEVAFVEVSSNGVDFARFPSAYFGPQVEPGAFGSVIVGSYANLTGQTPVRAASSPSVDPQDVVEAGGDAFDLADLATHPLVLQNLVDLDAITQVRIVDARSGIDQDSRGVLVRDAGTNGADIDAVTVIHHVGEITNDHPTVSLQVAVDGTFLLRLEDPQGWQDLDPATLRAALFGQPIDPYGLLTSLQVVQIDTAGFTLAQPFPLPAGVLAQLSFSVKDRAGHRSGVQRSRPDR